jgi:ABC-2 type transport system permease protein
VQLRAGRWELTSVRSRLETTADADGTLTRVSATAERARVEPRHPALATLRHQARIVWVIASSEFKLKYADSALGYVWSLLKPLGLFAMLYVVFGRFLKLGAGISHYPLYLLLGIVLWTFFSDSTSLGMESIVKRATLLSKLSFPRVVIPVSVTASSAITFGVNLIAFAVLLAFNRIVPDATWLLIPVLLLELYVFVLGLTFFLSTVYVRLRDIGQVWELALLLLFYASPIIYSASALPTWFQKITYLNPFVQVTQDVRAIVLPSSGTITAATVYGSPLGELLPIAVALLFFATGYVFFRREEPWLAERA